MKRVLFLIKNIRDQRYGILCLASYLKMKGHTLDYIHVTGDINSILNKIEQFKPNYLAVTAMSGEIKRLLDVLKEIKMFYPELYVVLGGPHATFSPDIIENPLVNAICRGEGELAFAEFLEKHPEGDYLSVRNFSFKEDGKIIKNPLRPLVDINKLPDPDYHFIKRQNKEKIIVFASRNCIFNCTYCFNREYRKMYRDECGQSQTYSYMTVDRFITQLKNIKNDFNFKVFYFQDDVFPVMDRKWLLDFCRRYPKEVSIPFHIGISPKLVTDERVSLIKQAGCFSVNMAVESGSERIRNKIMMRPMMTNDEIVNACHILKRHNIYIDSENMIMCPTETLEEAKQTLELNIKCKVDGAGLAKFQPYPGTRLTQFAIKRGLVDKENIIDRIPENFHWTSILKFDEKQAVQMDNLTHFFAITLKYPFIRRAVYAVIPYRLDWLFHHIDDQFWMTHTHRSLESRRKRTFLTELKIHLLFIKRLFIPKRRSDFVY